VSLVQEAKTQGCRTIQACKDIGIDRKSLKRWMISSQDMRKGKPSDPFNKITIDEKRKILQLVTSREYVDLSPRQIVPKLADKGIYVCSESSIYRILKEKNLLTHRLRSKIPEKNRPKPLIATRPNQIYSWDITYLKTAIQGQFFYFYCVMDIYSRKIVGYEVHFKESCDISSQLIEKICKKENIDRHQLVLHSDNGSSMKGSTMLAMLQKLGVVPSFSRAGVSDDNPFSESLFRTLKYCPHYPLKVFKDIGAARLWAERFVFWYNNVHAHSGIKFVTPSEKHNGEDFLILSKRKALYEKARFLNPYRWAKNTRNWDPILKVYLNHLQHKNESAIKNIPKWKVTN
jgi:transposase InsO family protein